ncbi:MAG: NapC/NirT family cytochrome c [Actinobacteria bacterium]|nr:NapC/NirT family cytochrome c [Actinomycetota bacterium]
MLIPNLKEMSPRTKRFILVQGTALVIFILASLVIGNTIVNRPQTCQICHEMNASVEAWQESSHEKIICTKCHHKEEGYYGFILAIPHKITDGIKHVTGEYEKPIRAKTHTEDRVCQRCHVSWRNVSPSGDLIVPHNVHFEKKKIPCVKCHSNVVHGEIKGGIFKRRPPMQLCYTCHGGGSKDAPTLKCKDCHTEKGIPASHTAKDWFETHGKLSKDPKHPDSKCDTCHGWTQDFCSDCHKNNLPSTHYGGTKWRTYHSIRAKERKSGCLVCHNAENFCYRCHDPFED